MSVCLSVYLPAYLPTYLPIEKESLTEPRAQGSAWQDWSVSSGAPSYPSTHLTVRVLDLCRHTGGRDINSDPHLWQVRGGSREGFSV